MSASLLVDLGNTCLLDASISPAAGVAGTPASGIIVGKIVDMLQVDTATQLVISCGPSTSGQCKVQVQTSDDTASGTFTDPTSGLASFPGNFLSGGILVYNSGNAQQSGSALASWFQRPHRYARTICMSGDLLNAPLTTLLIGNIRSTSGGGFTFSPGSGTISV